MTRLTSLSNVELLSLLLSDPGMLSIPKPTHATSRHVQQLIGITALPSVSPWTLESSSNLSPAHLNQDQLGAWGGERKDLLLLHKGWSVGDKFWFVAAIGVSLLYVLNLQINMISRGKSVLHEVTPELVEVDRPSCCLIHGAVQKGCQEHRNTKETSFMGS
jgi:hypothetical protein